MTLLGKISLNSSYTVVLGVGEMLILPFEEYGYNGEAADAGGEQAWQDLCYIYPSEQIIVFKIHNIKILNRYPRLLEYVILPPPPTARNKIIPG